MFCSMKRNVVGFIILSVIMILSLVGCARGAYICDVVENESADFVAGKSRSEDYVIRIGEATFDTQYISSKKSNLTNEIYDVYGIVEGDPCVIRRRISVDAKTGEVVGFSNISPYPQIDNIDKLSDAELKEIVESLMGELADFAQYNEFKADRPHSSDSVYYLLWQVKREALCNIKVEVYITASGSITSFYKADACPDELTKPFVNDTERDRLIEERIKAHPGIDSVEDTVYEIQSEVLTYYNNAPAIIYDVKIVEDGFAQVICLVIYRA